MDSQHYHEVAAHFLSLNARDRLLRFGRDISDAELVTYVEGLLRRPEEVFAVLEPEPDVAGVACLDFSAGCADLGLSVADWARRKGVGACLLERAAQHARLRGERTLFVGNLTGNPALRRLAMRLGMVVADALADGSTRLALPPHPDDGPSSDVARGPAYAAAMTLADRSLLVHWRAGAAGVPAALDRSESFAG
jgi:GNAT superfamily N-acetyltransferase